MYPKIIVMLQTNLVLKQSPLMFSLKFKDEKCNDNMSYYCKNGKKTTVGMVNKRKGQEKDSDADSWTTVYTRKHSPR